MTTTALLATYEVSFGELRGILSCFGDLTPNINRYALALPTMLKAKNVRLGGKGEWLGLFPDKCSCLATNFIQCLYT